MLLNTELASWLPHLVVKFEEHDLGTDSVLDTLNGSSLVLWGWAGSAVALTSRWPTSLHDVDILAWADAAQVFDLLLNECTSTISSDGGVEESVEVTSDDIDNIAPGGALALPDRKFIGSGDSAVVTSTLECFLGRGDEASEIGSTAILLEDSFVTDNDELNDVPLSPLGDRFDLRLSARDTSTRDEDTEDDLEAVALGGRSDVLEGIAVSAIDFDGAEAFLSDCGNIAGNGTSILAATSRGIDGVGHTELVAVSGNTCALRTASRVGVRAAGAGGLAPGRPA